ncbi:MAG TPA: hypothetical protein VHO06_04665 [Polyangia bacterium]|nr:hypothetical protein [Polyangia bacterium]
MRSIGVKSPPTARIVPPKYKALMTGFVAPATVNWVSLRRTTPSVAASAVALVAGGMVVGSEGAKSATPRSSEAKIPGRSVEAYV